MKKALILIAGLSPLCFSSFVSAHDLPKGTVEVGGDLDLSFSSVELEFEGFEEVDTDTLTVSGDILYYVADNVALGITVEYESAEASSGGDKVEMTTRLIGPAVGYNISLDTRTSLKLLGAIVSAEIESDDSFSGSESADGYGWLIAGRFGYFLNDHVSLNATLQYTSLALEDDATGVDLDGTGFSFGLGLSAYF